MSSWYLQSIFLNQTLRLTDTHTEGLHDETKMLAFPHMLLVSSVHWILLSMLQNYCICLVPTKCTIKPMFHRKATSLSTARVGGDFLTGCSSMFPPQLLKLCSFYNRDWKCGLAMMTERERTQSYGVNMKGFNRFVGELFFSFVTQCQLYLTQ